MLDYEGAHEIERAWHEGLTPDPLLSVSAWADQHRMLSSKASAEPGRWRTARTPYLREIMDCLSPASPIERVVLMKGAQVGGTECGSCWIGYVIHRAPGPMMAVWPTVEMAKRNSKQRIDPLIEESPVLAALIAPARSRDAGNTILAKEFRGGVLVMTGANSAVGLRSMPVRYLFLDEVDGYPLDVEGEGDAISLAEARTRTFTRRKIFIVSTPTIAGASSIEREYEASDQRRYFVPCTHCAHAQWLRFEQLRWDRGRPETVAYMCESCDMPIVEHHKTWMLEQGQWRATAPGNGRTAGFHLSSLYSPVGWRSWREIAAAWESAIDKTTGSASAIKTFKNTELGETWVEEGEAPDWQQLLERREDYRIGHVPRGSLLLVGGADVQKDRIEVSVWAFGRSKEAWLVEHRVLMGDTARVGPGLGEQCGRGATAAGAFRHRYRFRDARGLRLRARLPRQSGDGGEGRGARRGADRDADGGGRHRRRQKAAARREGVHGGCRYCEAGAVPASAPAHRCRGGRPDAGVSGGLHPPAEDRCRVPAAVVRGAVDHAAGPERLCGPRVAEAARAQRGARLLRVRARRSGSGRAGSFRGSSLARIGTLARHC